MVVAATEAKAVTHTVQGVTATCSPANISGNWQLKEAMATV